MRGGTCPVDGQICRPRKSEEYHSASLTAKASKNRSRQFGRCLERVRQKAGTVDEIRSDGVVLPGETDFSRIRDTGRPDDDRAATVFDPCF